MIARPDGDGGSHLRFGHSDLEPLVEGGVDDYLAWGEKRGDAGRGKDRAKDDYPTRSRDYFFFGGRKSRP
jgi:hypothetical protein